MKSKIFAAGEVDGPVPDDSAQRNTLHDYCLHKRAVKAERDEDASTDAGSTTLATEDASTDAGSTTMATAGDLPQTTAKVTHDKQSYNTFNYRMRGSPKAVQQKWKLLKQQRD